MRKRILSEKQRTSLPVSSISRPISPTMTPSNKNFFFNSDAKSHKNLCFSSPNRIVKNLSSAIITTDESSVPKSEITHMLNRSESKKIEKTQANPSFGNEEGNYYFKNEQKQVLVQGQSNSLQNLKKKEENVRFDLGNGEKNEKNSNFQKRNFLNSEEKWNSEYNKKKEIYVSTPNCSYQIDLSPSNSNKFRNNFESNFSPKNDQLIFSNYLIKEPPPIFFTKHNEMIESLNLLTEMRKKLEINFFNAWERKGKTKLKSGRYSWKPKTK